jgi:hypothetical protein
MSNELMPLIESIAAELGAIAKQAEGYHYLRVILHGAANYPLVISQESGRAGFRRLTVSDNFEQRDAAGRWIEAKQFTRSITVSIDRSPASIAADVRRRLLPDLDKLQDYLTAELAKRAASLSVAAQTAAEFQRLAVEAGLRVEPSSYRSAGHFDVFGVSGAELCHAEEWGKITLGFHHFSATPAQAVAILKLIGSAS